MHFKNWKKEICTVPNLFSLIRLLLIPVYMRIYLRADTPSGFYLAGSILALSCLTDLADGQIARRFHAVTTLGKILDPLADKATQLTLTFCLALRHRLLFPVLCILILKESFQLTAALLALRHGKMLPGALPAGKLCTAVLFISLILMVIYPTMPGKLLLILSQTDLVFLIISFGSYVLAYCGITPAVRDIPQE